MANPVFQFFRGSEFKTYSGIAREMIEMFGVQIYYLPKVEGHLDYLYGEDPLKSFDKKYDTTMYVENTGGWEGQGDMYAKFGIELNDEGTFKIQKDQFTAYTGMPQPLIGDLLYLPWQKHKALMEITNVDAESPFYHLGETAVWTIKCKRFQYSQEPITALQDADEPGQDIQSIIDNKDYLNDAPHVETEDTEEDVVDTSESDPFGS
jgi:hypothetical protein